MKMLVRCGLFFFLAIAFVISASALPPLPPYIEEHYSKSPAHAKYLEMYKQLEGEHKCDSWHKPEMDKKEKGQAMKDYGEGVQEHLAHHDSNNAEQLGQE